MTPAVHDNAGSKLFRTGIDDLPELFAVLDLLHLGGQPAVAADPVLHRLRDNRTSGRTSLPQLVTLMPKVNALS